MRSHAALLVIATLSTASAAAETAALAASEVEMAAALRRLVGALPASPPGAVASVEDARQLLERAQRAWTAARDAQCALEVGLRDGDDGVAHATRCVIDANRDRARRLEELADLTLMSGP